ncbi:M20 aminoacylase family protein [uncultured Cohaesibacter sp.]|uniref:M20 aminoacylase family protein n=1 Tax=uncultured Cohaesibacter sp. TaxID=1002546 RepID=UPI00292CCD23|nr:M20 aminoacylase family protein [uncultured Cohaesibacter sp.]
MPIINRIAEFQNQIKKLRQDLHEYPELQYDVQKTTTRIISELKSYGISNITSGVGRSGVVAVIQGKSNKTGRTIGLRADMDALPLHETTGKPYASKVEGKMHACGHDGHTAMLLAAAKYLQETRNFDGEVVLIFQPAEEGGGGARAMVEDGLMDRWNIEQVYGMHNWPNVPVGAFHMCSGPIMASADRLKIEVEGKGGHAAKPHECVDTIVVMAAIIQAVQTIASRNTDPQKSIVVSLCHVNAGFTDNVIPQTGLIEGTVRTLDPAVRNMAETRLKQIVEGTAAIYGAKASLSYIRDYPVTVNHDDQTKIAAKVAKSISGADKVETDIVASMGSEDFSFMLQERPGAFVFVGNGNSAALHHPDYDFNDELIPIGASYWAKLVEEILPA